MATEYDYEDLIAQARQRYADDDVAIEDDAEVSWTTVGAWVQAWVWVDFVKEDTDG